MKHTCTSRSSSNSSSVQQNGKNGKIWVKYWRLKKVMKCEIFRAVNFSRVCPPRAVVWDVKQVCMWLVGIGIKIHNKNFSILFSSFPTRARLQMREWNFFSFFFFFALLCAAIDTWRLWNYCKIIMLFSPHQRVIEKKIVRKNRWVEIFPPKISLELCRRGISIRIFHLNEQVYSFFSVRRSLYWLHLRSDEINTHFTSWAELTDADDGYETARDNWFESPLDLIYLIRWCDVSHARRDAQIS